MKSSPQLIFIDTNVLYHAVDYNYNILEKIKEIINVKFDIVIHPKVEEEIIDALTTKGKIAKQAKFAIQLIALFSRYNDYREYNGADTALLKAATREKGVIFTFDKELKERCVKNNIAVLTHYKIGRLQLIGYID